jgi:hypothetical protein
MSNGMEISEEPVIQSQKNNPYNMPKDDMSKGNSVQIVTMIEKNDGE